MPDEATKSAEDEDVAVTSSDSESSFSDWKDVFFPRHCRAPSKGHLHLLNPALGDSLQALIVSLKDAQRKGANEGA